jgi:hypothetical protein
MNPINLKEITPLVEVTQFGRVRDIYNNNMNTEGLAEFVQNIILSADYSEGRGKMLPELSDIYVLVANESYPFSYKGYVLGFIWLSNLVIHTSSNTTYHFINCIDSRVPGLNIAKYMIDAYETSLCRLYIQLLPQEIIPSAKLYWKKHFCSKYGIRSKLDLEEMIRDHGITNIKWDELQGVLV